MNTINAVKVAKSEKKAELVLKNCLILNVFNEKIEKGDIAIENGLIVGIGNYEGEKEVNINWKYVCPGFIDGHVHIESSMVTPSQFAKTVVPKGTTTIIEDPHEIANVCGISGIEYILNNSKDLPLDIFIMLPSCVPATDFENSGAKLLASDLKPLLNNKNVLGLGEVMNYVGVINNDSSLHEKLNIANGLVIDGHSPKLFGKELNAYISAGVKTDHECVDIAEMEEKISKGMYVHIREGSATKNLKDLIKGVKSSNSRRIIFCTDDKHPGDIKNEGHINYNVKLAIKEGIEPVKAIQMATLNAAECYRLYDRGAIAPGYIADILVLDNLQDINILKVYKNGKLVAENKKLNFKVHSITDKSVLDSVKLKDAANISFDIYLKSSTVNVIQLIEHSNITKKVTRRVDIKNNKYINNSDIDILKLAIIERHKLTGNVGLGLVEGYGLKNGAIALTIAHDSHNILVIGDNDTDMHVAITELNKVKGGITICQNGKVLSTLQLEVAGLMTDSPIENVEEKIIEMVVIARKMGVNEGFDPFVSLAFLSLPVIPELKLTDCGLFDTNLFKFIDVDIY